MLDTLRRIVQDVSVAPDLQNALMTTVNRIRDAMQTASCCLYLADEEDREFVMMATAGLNPQMIGQVRLTRQQGLIGQVAARQELLNIVDATHHPHFHPVDGIDEKRLCVFLGVPLIQYCRVIGVLAVQDTAARSFDAADESFLLTIAAQLAGVLHPIILTQDLREPLNPPAYGCRALRGLPGAPGIAIGTGAVPYSLTDIDDVPDRLAIDPVAEEAAFHAAIAAVEQDLREAGERLAPLLPPAEHALFTAYQMMLHNDSLLGQTLAGIRAGRWAPTAWRDAVRSRIRLLERMEDPYLSTRATDLRNLGRQVLGHLQTDQDSSLDTLERYVLVAEEMSVAHLATVSPEQLAGVVCLQGSALSHVALLARAMGVPAVMGLGHQPLGRFENRKIIVDGYQGRVYVEPDKETLAEYQRRIAAESELSAELCKLRELPAITMDHHTIPIYTKAALPTDIDTARKSGANGIGLYRTEIAFMVRASFPSEDEQRHTYQQMLSVFSPKPVVMRTLDIGGDKALPYFAIDENNPFLGWRGIRLTLDHPEIFLMQLRALLRANADCNNLRILFPMITTVEEIDRILQLLEQAQQELQKEGKAFSRPKIGIMIEIPSAAWQAEQLARKVDFLSIGTNDLTQYLMAVDRDNPRVAHLYDNLHPAMLKAIAYIVAAGQKTNRPVNLGGEMAADPGVAVMLLGMGVSSLSVSAISVPRVKWTIRSFTLTQAQALAKQALKMDTASEIRNLLNNALRKAGLDRIVHEIMA